jgi:Raf kinase inhibitor-like YbhB/YbcL family protein
MNKSIIASTVALAVLPLLNFPAVAQPKGTVGEFSDVDIQGAILEPKRLEIDGQKAASLLKLPDGFRAELFAENLINPRMLAVSSSGKLYATRRSVGDVILIEDADGDGRAENIRTVASRPGMHGITFAGQKVYLATVNDIYTADVQGDGTFGPLRRIINDLPDGGQHPNRTLALGPDGMLYISVGSTCNACAETNPESATILRSKPDGSSRSIFARGLRNTIGFDWEPSTGNLFGWDHGIDWLGDQEQVEELNLIQQGHQYGWPYIYGDDKPNPQDNPPEGITLSDWAKKSDEPALGYTAHSAPMQAAFYNGNAFPESYRGDLFVAMRGSWNRRPPSGYEVLRVEFENGKPVGFQRFLEGFLRQQDDGSYGYLGRLAGLAVGADGSLFVADDSNGRIYRVSYTGGKSSGTGLSKPPATVSSPPPSDLAMKLVDVPGRMSVDAPFTSDQTIPDQHVADGDNASPPITWRDPPADAKSFVVMMEDPDAAEPKPFVHWIMYDIPKGTLSIREGIPTEAVIPEPKGTKQGMNSAGSTGYMGPKPPVGDPPHNYHLQVFALDIATLGLSPGSARSDVIKAMQGHVLAAGEQVGTYQRGNTENTKR